MLLNKSVTLFIKSYRGACNYSKLASKLEKQPKHLIISCKQKKFNFYSDTVYNNLDEVELASKGWTHHKARGDYFTVHPIPDLYLENTKTFPEIGILPSLIDVLKEEGISEATAFQSEAIPNVNLGKHLILAAETGCGKTIAYLLPIVQNLIKCRATELNTPKALILVPNRELAHQIGDVARRLAKAVDLQVKVIVGGSTKKLMMNPEFGDVDILVATPGVIGKLSTVGIYKLHEVLYTVLDECDTLMDDSFVERMSSLMRRVSQSQIILVSATFPKNIPDYLQYIESNLSEVKSLRLHKPLLNVTQKFLRLNKSLRPPRLLEIAKTTKDPLLIFSNRNETCNWIALFLRENNLLCSNINGDMNYNIRVEQWKNFLNGNTKILSATDVGSRGLDTTYVKQVLNYDFPLYAADYIHRVGRVGRLGSPDSCKVINFICGMEEIKLVQQIELAIRKDQEIPNVDGNITNIFQKKILRHMKNNSIF